MSTNDIRIQPLDRAAHRALAGWIADAQEAGIDIDDASSLEKAYEDYFTAVQETPAADRTDPTQMLTMIGIAMGEHVQRRTEVSWRVATDTDGPDLALVGADETGVFFPVDPVADNWNAGLRGWLAEFTEQVVASLGAPSA